MSRTSQAKYLRNRATVLRRARANGLTHCPGWTDAAGEHPCGRLLDWTQSGTDASVEADHIIPSKYGGTDDVDNLQPLCLACNRAKGDGTRVLAPFAPADLFPTSRAW